MNNRAAVRLAFLFMKKASFHLLDEAVQEFGTTRNPDEAGYILPDGRLLDFSGRRHLKNEYRRVGDRFAIKPGKKDWRWGQRDEDHREISVLTQESSTEGMHEFMRETGAIRLLPRVGIDLIKKPTDAQIRLICLIWNKYWSTEPLFIQRSDNKGHVVKTSEVAQPITRRKVLSLF